MLVDCQLNKRQLEDSTIENDPIILDRWFSEMNQVD